MKEQVKGSSYGMEIPVKVEVYEFYGKVSELERKRKDLGGGLLIENERDKGIKISV